MAAALAWGRHYAVVEPTHFRVAYSINPFMDPADQPDPGRARAQWDGLVATLRSTGAEVEVIPARPEAPDMVYAMNLGLAVTTPADERRLLLSHMRHPQRRLETPAAAAWFAGHGWRTSAFGRDGIGPSFEAGDAFPFRDCLVVGYGPRTDELALKHLAAELGVRVRGVRTVHPAMYHLDLAFCPLDARRALICPDAFDARSAAALLALIPEPILISEAEALGTLCANSVVVGSTIVMPGCPPRVRAELERAGVEVVLLDADEFHKGGGSVRCLTNPLDIRLGRDLAITPGAE